MSSISLSPATPTVERGKTVQMQATAKLSDGTTQDVTSKGSWDISDSNIATVSNEAGSVGLVTGNAVGSAQVLFAYADPKNSNKQVSAQAALEVSAPPKGSVVALPVGAQTTTESGGTAFFTVSLASAPTANVTIAVSSSNTAEGTVSPAELVFTPASWNAPQTVTVTGVDDSAADGPQQFKAVLGAAVSADDVFSGVDPDDLTLTNQDNDTAGITVAPTSGLTTTEAGGTAKFTVVLNSKPTASVAIGLQSSVPTEGTVSPASLTFTPENWNAPQTVTITGIDDSVADGSRQYIIVTAPAVSTDPGYLGVDAANVSVSNTDNDSAGITVAPTSGLTTTEAGGHATFTVVLNSKPTANVTVGLTSSEATEGSVSPASLTFTPANWNAPQTVTVTGLDDTEQDGNQPYTIITAAAVSEDPGYSGRDAANVSVSNTDNDTAGITVEASAEPTTTEAGGQATFTVVLNTKPSANVVIALSSSDATEGTVSPAALTFTADNWNAPQTVTIAGMDDSEQDGNQPYTIVLAAAASSDSHYSGVKAADLSVTNVDNDTAGITVSPISELSTTEAGGQATFTVVLNSEPTANVVIALSSSNTAEGTVSPASLTFTADNWNAPQTVTVTGLDDEVQDGSQPYTIRTAAAVSNDSRYSDKDADDVSVSNTDDDTAGFTVSSISGPTTEDGGQATFTVVLNSRPTADVTIALTSNDTFEGTVSPASLTFTAENWNAPQTVTVTGVNDSVQDGPQPYEIVTAAAVSEDTNYSGKDVPDVSLSNTDDDTAGITVHPISGLTTTEAGGQATFTVVLNSRPTADVTIALTSSETTEGSVSPASLTFTADNWNAPQTVTVTGVNDDVQDGPQPYSIVTAAAVSEDPAYSGLNADDAAVSNTDNDTASIAVSLISGPTTEAGGTATFTVVLNSRPTADVTIGLTSSDTAEGTVSPASLTFTADNWNAPQTATVTGVNDDAQDGPQPYSIITAAAVSDDSHYNEMNAADVSVSNTDDDTAGITVHPTSGLVTTEAAGAATFTVVLHTRPTADVTIGLTSNDTTEGTVSPASLTFTADNWNAPQTVTVTGVNDDVQDGDQTYSVVLAAATSVDANFNGMDASDVSVTNNDNDTAGITVSAISGTTTEAGDTATFTVVLRTQPTANVIIGVSSNDTTEGTVSPASLTFTAANWNAAQTVTVTGVNDDVMDGDQPYTIILAPAVAEGTHYSGLDASDVSVTNADDDNAGITVSPISGLITTEAGGTATFTVALVSRPTANVVIGLSSNDVTEGAVSPSSLTFTPDNWNAPQTVTVTGQPDSVVDGDQLYAIVTAPAVSDDPNYSGRDAANVQATNNDGDTAGVTVDPLSITVYENGAEATFTVVLTSQPAANVTIGLASSDIGEGTVSPASVTFTPLNWNAPQTVTVTGVNDDVQDGAQSFSIATAPAVSDDPLYANLNAADVSATNVDNDTAGITVNPMAGLTTTENGGVALFTVVLNSEPTANVTIGLTSNDTTEGTVSPASVTFTPVNWNAPQVVTVTGVNDSEQDGPQSYAIVTAPAVSDDANYNTMDAANVAVANRDNDSPGITVYPSSGLTTTEVGGTATFQVVLDGPPTADVTIGLASSDTTEGTVSPASVTFTTVNWNAPQTVTITGVNDLVADGNQPYQIITAAASSTDPGYDGLGSFDVSVSNTDNDSAGITVSAISGNTTEAGGAATFTVVLNSQPTADVTIAVSSSDTGEGTVAPASLTFTSVNWNAPQTVTVTGLNDDVQDGNQPYTILLAPAVSTDTSGYSGMDPANVQVTNTDNDTAGITVDVGEGVTTTEAGGTGTFTIVLNSEPTADVIISLSSNETTEGTVSPIEVTFTADNWNAPQTVTVTGVDDDVQDGDQPYTIVTAAAVSTDTNYGNMDAANVSVTNIDNDSAGITVSAISGNTTEVGGAATFTIVLHSEPTANVTIALSSSDTTEGTVSPASLTFTPVNWNAPQTVTVTGVNDDVQDGSQPYTIVTAAAVSDDGNYNGRDAANVSVSNTDDDTAGITVSAISGATNETGGTATFTIVLNSEPTADVTIALSSNDTTEGTVSPASLTFTAINWNAPQTVTITGVNDDVQDGNQPFIIVTAAAVSTDGHYNTMNAADVSVTNTDDDTAGITVSAISGPTTEAGATATFTVVLTSQPTADVTIALSSNDTTEGTISPASLTFTAVNWNAPQTVTVTGVDDDVMDGNQPFTIVTAAAVSTDANYNTRDADNVAVTNTDDDTAGITVSAISGATTEAGGTATFTVVLNSEPTADVTIAVTSNDTTEGTVSPASLTFTAVNWNAPQTVTITGVNDDVQDGNQPFTIVTAAAVSDDGNYNGRDAANVSVTNLDNDSAGIHGAWLTSPSTTTEAGGTSTFNLVLNSEPTADVTITLSTGDATEGTVSPSSLTFTALNWNAPQVVTVTGVDDFVQDGNQVYAINISNCASSDPNYNNRFGFPVSLTNTDDDTAGFVITPSSGLATSEPNGAALFTVRLQSQPIANVTLPLSSNDVTEGTVSPDSLTFTPSNWNTPQIVTVTGVNDDLRDGNQPYQIVTGAATSDDPNYSGMDPTNVTLTNTDDDSPGFIITPTSGLVTTEAAGTATFTIVLLAPPTADVTFTLTSSDLTEGTALPAQVTFTPANWSTPQTITVVGIDDFVADGNQPYTITTNPAESTDLGYAGLNPADVSCTNQDNDD